MRGSKRSEISSFIVMDVMREAAAREAEGEDVVHMEVGQPAASAPKTAIKAAEAAMGRDALGYTLALGLPALRQRIAAHYQDTYGVTLDPARVVVTSGSSAGFVLSFLALFDAGDRVALPTPGYPCYRHILSALGLDTPLLVTGPETRWMPTVESLAKVHTERALSGLIIASPANPTGTMITRERMLELSGYCRDQGIWLISDEIYHGLTYDAPAITALSAMDDAIIVNSFSKYYAMTGWRVGWLIVPDALVGRLERLAQNFYISPPAISQVAAAAAFDGREELEQNRHTYAANREILIDGLAALGFDQCAPADGAFYIYADISKFAGDAATFARQMLHETGVAVTPGIDFDADNGHRFIRFCYAGSTDDMKLALKRLAGWPALKR